jgi:3-oxoacyl-[acyl-carrier protein] reductase
MSVTAPRRALVTGGSRGIGAACVAELSQRGFDVVATFHRPLPEGEVDRLERDLACGPGRVRVMPFACEDRGDVERLLEDVDDHFGGPPDTVVANAGINDDGLAMQMSDAHWDHVIEVNLTSVFRLVRRVVRPMVRNRFGRVVLIGSVAGLSGAPGQANYAATKAGLVGLARTLSREVAHRGVTCNVVAPGVIDTDMVGVLPAQRQAEFATLIPARRFGAPEEVAHVVAMLADTRAGYVSGALIPVDGGLGMGH